MTVSDCLTVPARSEHTATVVFLHGLNSTGYDWQNMATTFANLPGLRHVKWVLPHAPRIPITFKGGEVVHGWYDIFDLDYALGEDEAGILSSCAAIEKIIRQEIDSGIPASRIVLAGFSQGGAMSLFTGLITGFKLAGLVNLSGRFLMQIKLPNMVTAHAKLVPIFWGHGQQDVKVKYDWVEPSVTFLKNDLNIREASRDDVCGLELHSYKGLEHGTRDDELQDLQAWLRKVIPV